MLFYWCVLCFRCLNKYAEQYNFVELFSFSTYYKAYGCVAWCLLIKTACNAQTMQKYKCVCRR